MNEAEVRAANAWWDALPASRRVQIYSWIHAERHEPIEGQETIPGVEGAR